MLEPVEVFHGLKAAGLKESESHRKYFRLSIVFVVHGAELQPYYIFWRQILEAFLKDCTFVIRYMPRPR